MKGTIMKLWTLAGENVSSGIAVILQPYPHILVGNRRIALGKRDFPEPPEHLAAADIYVTQKGTTLLVAEEDPTDPIGLVLTVEPQDDPWYREWTLNQFEEVPCPNQGKVGTDYNCVLCGVKYPAKFNSDLFSSANIHPDQGMAQEWNEYQDTGGIQTVMSCYTPPSRTEKWGYRSAGYSTHLRRMCPGEVLHLRSGVHGEPQYNSDNFLVWTGEELLFLQSWEIKERYEQYKARSQ